MSRWKGIIIGNLLLKSYKIYLRDIIFKIKKFWILEFFEYLSKKKIVIVHFYCTT